MVILIKLGILTIRLIKLADKYMIPICAACMFGQAHRKIWSNKGTYKKSQKLRRDTDDHSGAGTSTDELHINQAGLAAQASGKLTSVRVSGATLFVDHCTYYVYNHLMHSLSGDKTLEAKHRYERLASTNGHTVKIYHADNGRFGKAKFKNDFAAHGQEGTFFGLGAHHQNGIAEIHIKEFTLVYRTLLLDAKSHWHDCITTILYPYNLFTALYRYNYFKVDDKGV